jgi:hypothetical protein
MRSSGPEEEADAMQQPPMKLTATVLGAPEQSRWYSSYYRG